MHMRMLVDMRSFMIMCMAMVMSMVVPMPMLRDQAMLMRRRNSGGSGLRFGPMIVSRRQITQQHIDIDRQDPVLFHITHLQRKFIRHR